MTLELFGSFDGQNEVWQIHGLKGYFVLARDVDNCKWYAHHNGAMIKWRWLDNEGLEAELEQLRDEIVREKKTKKD
jgi:hypothetical protein